MKGILVVTSNNLIVGAEPRRAQGIFESATVSPSNVSTIPFQEIQGYKEALHGLKPIRSHHEWVRNRSKGNGESAIIIGHRTQLSYNNLSYFSSLQEMLEKQSTENCNCCVVITNETMLHDFLNYEKDLNLNLFILHISLSGHQKTSESSFYERGLVLIKEEVFTQNLGIYRDVKITHQIWEK